MRQSFLVWLNRGVNVVVGEVDEERLLLPALFLDEAVRLLGEPFGQVFAFGPVVAMRSAMMRPGRALMTTTRSAR